jgi:hypothetical protein
VYKSIIGFPVPLRHCIFEAELGPPLSQSSTHVCILRLSSRFDGNLTPGKEKLEHLFRDFRDGFFHASSRTNIYGKSFSR